MRLTHLRLGSACSLFVLFACQGPPDAGGPADEPGLEVSEAALASRTKAVRVDFLLEDAVTPTADPCVLRVFEHGSARSAVLGDAQWSAELVSQMCSRGERAGNTVAAYTFSFADGAKIFGTYETTTEVDAAQTLHWRGTWKLTGGTGRFEGIRGKGKIPEGGDSLISPEPFPCAFDGVVIL